jgi:molybdate transport system substrate-binding protein
MATSGKALPVWIFLVGLIVSLAGCSSVGSPVIDGGVRRTSSAEPPARNATSLVVFAAASLSEAFTTIGERFEAAHGVKVTFNFAGSQQLAQQLAGGASADVFASANQKEMDKAIKAGVVRPGTDEIFARNRLVVITPKERNGKVTQLQDLAKSGLRLVLAAEQVPAGQYAQQVLDKMSRDAAFGVDFKMKVNRNVVSKEENVRAVVTKVSLGEADAGIVYVSDVTNKVSGQIETITIPAQFNQLAAYPLAPTLKPPMGDEMAKAFVVYVLGPEGQRTLADNAFLPAK